MIRLIQYFGRFQQMQGNFTGLPSWARLIVLIFALPALAIAALAIVLFGVSILALLLLTVPAYRILSAVTGTSAISAGQMQREPSWVDTQAQVVDAPANDLPPISAGRRQIEVKIVQ